MYLERRQFSRGGQPYHPQRRFRGQYVRSRVSPPEDSVPPPQQQLQNYQQSTSKQQPPSQQHQPQQPQQQQQQLLQQQPQQQPERSKRNNQRNLDFEELKDQISKLSSELEKVKVSVEGVVSKLEQIHAAVADPQAIGDKRRKPKLLKKSDETNPIKEKPTRKVNKRDRSQLDQDPKPLPTKPNDDSTTQAADPSSEDKNGGDEGREGGRVRVFRRKKPFGQRKQGNRRRRFDSSERNSNDTSPQNEANGDEYSKTNQMSNSRGNNRQPRGPKRTYPQLSESELNEAVQNSKRDFLAAEIGSVRKLLDSKGPVVAQAFASAILEHAMCDVTSPTKINDIAVNLFHILAGDNGGADFQQGFYTALSEISKREDDIAIDAPRYMDTLGQVLGQCIVPMNTSRYRGLLRRFLNKCLQAYSQQSRASLLASVMRGIANHKSDRFAKEIWDTANLKWEGIINEEADLNEFLESQEVTFTTKTFSPEPRRPKKTPEELEKFADDVTDLVEKRCTPQTLDELVKDLELEADERVDYFGTLIYAIVRGCCSPDSEGDFKLNSEALSKYSSILHGKHRINRSSGDVNTSDTKKELDAVALHALTALTKLWHHHNCPQNLMSNILLALHNHGAASQEALKVWLNSDDLKNIPGIGAARLNSKRCIEDLARSQ